MVYNPFFVENLGRLVLLELYVYCIKERGLLKGQCCVVATENLAVILGLSLADVRDKGNACEQVWLEDDGCLVACSIFVRLKGEKT